MTWQRSALESGQLTPVDGSARHGFARGDNGITIKGSGYPSKLNARLLRPYPVWKRTRPNSSSATKARFLNCDECCPRVTASRANVRELGCKDASLQSHSVELTGHPLTSSSPPGTSRSRAGSLRARRTGPAQPRLGDQLVGFLQRSLDAEQRRIGRLLVRGVFACGLAQLLRGLGHVENIIHNLKRQPDVLAEVAQALELRLRPRPHTCRR